MTMRTIWVPACALAMTLVLAACNQAESPAEVARDTAEARQDRAEGVADAQADLSEAIAEGQDREDVAEEAYDVAAAKADGDHKVAVEQCERLAGDAQKACKDQADAVRDKAKADARAQLATQTN
jgi:hypothetical protein